MLAELDTLLQAIHQTAFKHTPRTCLLLYSIQCINIDRQDRIKAAFFSAAAFASFIYHFYVSAPVHHVQLNITSAAEAYCQSPALIHHQQQQIKVQSTYHHRQSVSSSSSAESCYHSRPQKARPLFTVISTRFKGERDFVEQQQQVSASCKSSSVHLS